MVLGDPRVAQSFGRKAIFRMKTAENVTHDQFWHILLYLLYILYASMTQMSPVRDARIKLPGDKSVNLQRNIVDDDINCSVYINM